MTLTDGTGYPTGGTGPFFLVLSPGLSTEEKVKCTARSGASVTGVTRGADGTSAVAHSEANPAVKHVFTKTDADEANAHYADTALDHHTQYHNTTRHAAVSHIIGTHLPTPATPTTVEIGTAASAGTTGPAAAEDHAHAFTGGLLAVVQYRPGAAGTYDTTSASFSDVDATNVVLTFTTPANGKVLVRCQANVTIGGATEEMEWAIREAAATVANTTSRIYYNDSGSDHIFIVGYDIYITGLVAASSHTYKLAYRSLHGGTVTIEKGPVYPVTMEVWAAP